MTATLPQLWLLDLRAYQETSRWRTLLPGLPPERQRRALPAQVFCYSRRSRPPVSPFLIRSSPKTNGESRALSLTPSIFPSATREISASARSIPRHSASMSSCRAFPWRSPRAAFIRTKRLFCRRCPKKRRKTRCFASGPRRKAISSISGAGCASRSIRSASVSMKTAPACRRPARLPPFACTNTRTTAAASACAPKAPARRFNSINRNKAAAG